MNRGGRPSCRTATTPAASANRRGHHAGAYVLASVEDTPRRAADDDSWVGTELVLADCGRQVQLDFGVDSGALANS